MVSRFVGQEPQVVLGKRSGKLSILQKLKELSLGELDGEKVERVLARVKQIGIDRKGLVTDVEFSHLVSQIRSGK